MKSQGQKLAVLAPPDAEDQVLLNKVAGYYAERLAANQPALDFLAQRRNRVLGTDGRLLPVQGIRAASGRVGTAYNFEVADIHTYQVGPQGILTTTTAICRLVPTRPASERAPY